MHIDPAAIPLADRYKLLIGGIVPRPIAFVCSISPQGELNLAPFSFFAGVAAEPLTLLFCPANKPDGSEKDTLRNVRPPAEGGTGQFVVNIVSDAFAREMAACAEPLPYGESEFDLSGLTTTPSRLVAPPRVAESSLAFECETMSVTSLAPGKPSGGNIVLGRIIHIWAKDGLVNERHHVDPAMLDAIGRMGGTGYARTRDRFEMPQGRTALDLPPP